MITYKPACRQCVPQLSSRCETTERRKQKTDNTSGERLKPGPVSKRIQSRQRRHGTKKQKNTVIPYVTTLTLRTKHPGTSRASGQCSQDCSDLSTGEAKQAQHRRTSTSGQVSAVHSHLKKWLSCEETMYTSWSERTDGLKEVWKKLSTHVKYVTSRVTVTLLYGVVALHTVIPTTAARGHCLITNVNMGWNDVLDF